MNEFDLLYNNIDKHSGVFKTETVTGIATSGSKTTIVDTNKSFITNMFSGAIVNFKIGTKDYYKTVVSNTENSITFTPTLPGTKATATIGTGTSEILVTAASEGVLGNTYQIKIQASSGTNDNLSASLIDGVLTVFLGKTEDVLDNTKNTATLVATAIDQLPEFISSTSNIGVVVVTTENIHFTGGVDTIDVLEGSKYIISEKVSSINKNTAGTEIFTDANPASMKLTGSLFPVVINIIPAFAVSTTAVPQSFTNQNITVHVLSGNCWYNPNTTSTTSNGFKLLPGMAIDLRVNGTLSLISDSTGATVQIAVWGS